MNPAIKAAIPHRPPFLFVDEIVERTDDRIICRKTFQLDDWFYTGHYPGSPITPGVLLCEAAMQAGAILLSELEPARDGAAPVVGRMNDVRFKRMVKPGETIEMEVSIKSHIAKAWIMAAKVTCGGQLALRFEFTCTMAAVD
jgi:3-hydroxyacyl-[acyl-carrier-protein] dehydratase